ncbi:MAG TPA: DUF1987 domain-containing protein [Rectinemataceae bacterium]|nr:DUF1987 domain-containing protein [Rectinemataceae bacterium]
MLNIPATTSTPAVSWDEGSATLSISGESYPENSFAFFDPVFAWLSSELPALGRFRLRVSVSYMNSSSTKCVLDIIDLVSEAAERGCDAAIVWLYDRDNERARDLAEEFREDVEIPFELCPVEGSNR